MSAVELPIALPRHSFSIRDAARAGDIWRAFQELAVEASTAAGWPPDRYRAEGSAFVVRSMRVVHHREAVYGERITGRTWVARFRKGFLSTREVRLTSARGPVASGTQEWVHVSASLEILKAPESLVAAFPVFADPHEPETLTDIPTHTPRKGRRFSFEFEAWHTWMDPLAHANHPAYVDWCDESLSRFLHGEGVDPVRLVPVAEEATYRSGVVAPERVTVHSVADGITEDGAVSLVHEVYSAGELRAKVRTVRRLMGDDAELARLLGVAE